MSDAAARPRRRLPLLPTLIVGAVFLVLVGLGVWQLARLQWKERLLARIAALQHAPALPIGPVLARAAAGADVAFTRVETACAPAAATPPVFRYAIHDGATAWRALALCRLPNPGVYDSVLIDRGLAEASQGLTAPLPQAFAPPGVVVGVLRAPGGRPWLGGETMGASGGGVRAIRILDAEAIDAIAVAEGARRPAPLWLAVQRETPAPAGLTPAALPTDIPNNHLGYALTWFGLAIALVWIYAARLAAPDARPAGEDG